MFKIGDFSRIAQVSVKALRHYGELGLFKPAWIDRYTGYRYYTAEQMPRLNRILALKDLGFSLEQITKLLGEDLPYAELRGMMRLKQAELEQSIQAEQARLERVEARLEQIESEGVMPTHEVVLKAVPSQRIVGVRSVIPGFQAMAPIFDDLHGYLLTEKASFEAKSPKLAIYYDLEFNDQGMDVEIAAPLNKMLSSKPPFLVHELPGVETMACAIHQGDYARLGETYQALMNWVEASGYHACGPNRELFLSPPREIGGTNLPITEIQLPVEKKPTRIYLSKHQEDDDMQPKIVEKPGFTVVGMVYEGKNEKNEIAGLWGRFNPRIAEYQNFIDGAFGVCEPAKEDGSFRYMAGMSVSKPDDAPSDMEIWEVPSHLYAVFPCTLQTIGETYKYAFETWLPGSGYRYTASPDFEYYDEHFDPNVDGSILYIYVPVKK